MRQLREENRWKCLQKGEVVLILAPANERVRTPSESRENSSAGRAHFAKVGVAVRISFLAVKPPISGGFSRWYEKGWRGSETWKDGLMKQRLNYETTVALRLVPICPSPRCWTIGMSWFL